MTWPPVFVTPRAEHDAIEAFLWYEKEVAGLGDRFLASLERALEAVGEGPLRYPVVHREIRRARLHRFPYGVFFRLRRDQIRILAVMNLTRHPSRWQSRR